MGLCGAVVVVLPVYFLVFLFVKLVVLIITLLLGWRNSFLKKRQVNLCYTKKGNNKRRGRNAIL